MGPRLLFQSPVQGLGMCIFNALNWSGQHVGFEFRGKHVRVKCRQNPKTVVPLLHLVFAHHMNQLINWMDLGLFALHKDLAPKLSELLRACIILLVYEIYNIIYPSVSLFLGLFVCLQ